MGKVSNEDRVNNSDAKKVKGGKKMEKIFIEPPQFDIPVTLHTGSMGHEEYVMLMNSKTG
jgi:hypothetical protein